MWLARSQLGWRLAVASMANSKRPRVPGAVVVGVSPCGLADREQGTVGFTTSLGLGKKFERIVLDPHVAVAYHARDHGFYRKDRRARSVCHARDP